MSHQPTVGQYMTAEPATADVGLLLADAEQRMNLDNIRHLVVVRDGRVVGMLSNRDVAVALSIPGAARKTLTIGDAMTEQPFVCGPMASISEVAHQMEQHRWGAAIIAEGDELVGVFTTTDALRALRALATGQYAEPAVKPTHLPSPDPEPPRRFHIRKHRPIDTHTPNVFTPSGS